MRHQVKKGLVLTLCAVLAALSAVSCGDAGKTMSGGSSQPEVSASSAESSESEAAVEPMKKYDPPITITTVFGEGNFEFPEGEDYGHNDMYQLWEDTMGVHIVNKIQCPATAVKEKMQMAIASNDIPDFGSVDATMLRTLIKNDMVEDMTDIYNTWASDNLKEVTGQSDNALFAPTLKDGRYMALPRANTIGDQLPILFIRSDWLDKLNLDPPKTVEEMFEIAEAFATQDPDGNGIADTYGIQMDKDLSKLPYLLASYGAYSKQWVKQEDGSYIAGCTDPKVKEGLQAMRDLYAAGGLDPEFAVKEEAKTEEFVAAGKIGMYIGFFWWPLGAMKDCVANVEGADWIAVELPPSKNMETYLTPVELNTAGYLYVRKGYEHPEAVVVMMNHLCDGYAAPWLVGEDTDFAKGYQAIAADVKYKNVAVNGMMPFSLAGNINWGPIFQEAIDKGEKHVFGKDQDYQNVISTELSPEMQWAWKKVYLEAYPVLGDFENLHYNDYTGSPTDTAVKVQSLLEKEMLTTFIGMIMGEIPIDSFDDFVKRYNSMGGEKIAQEIQAAMAE